MPAEADLRRIQRWMQEFIVDPRGDEEVFAADGGRAERLVTPSRTLAPLERVAIYRGQYLLRMMEALENDYPALSHFVGHAGFHRLVEGYVREHPSRSYTLNRLGDRLPDYLKTAPDVRRRAFAHDLARLELAISRVFDAPQSPALDRAAVAAVPPADWVHTRLRTIDAFRLLAFRYPVNAYLQSVKAGTVHPDTRRRDTWLAVYRRDYAVWRLPLSKQAFRLLEALAGGVTLAGAIRSVSGRGGPGEEQVFRWFSRWVTEGFFSSLERVEPARRGRGREAVAPRPTRGSVPVAPPGRTLRNPGRKTRRSRLT